MSLAEELLAQARFLASLDPHSPVQANLRRAVSSAYYAVFHLLSAEVVNLIIPLEPKGMREKIQRSLTHKQMKTVADAFLRAYKCGHSRRAGKGSPGDGKNENSSAKDSDSLLLNLLPEPISSDLSAIAEGIGDLYQARMDADYDLTKTLDSTYVRTLLKTAETIFSGWSTEKTSHNAPVFLTSLMFGQFWTSNLTGK